MECGTWAKYERKFCTRFKLLEQQISVVERGGPGRRRGHGRIRYLWHSKFFYTSCFWKYGACGLLPTRHLVDSFVVSECFFFPTIPPLFCHTGRLGVGTSWDWGVCARRAAPVTEVLTALGHFLPTSEWAPGGA